MGLGCVRSHLQSRWKRQIKIKDLNEELIQWFELGLDIRIFNPRSLIVDTFKVESQTNLICQSR